MDIYILLYLFFSSVDPFLSSPIVKRDSDVYNNAVAEEEFSLKTAMPKIDDYFSKMHDISEKQIGKMDQDSNEIDSSENKEYITEAHTKNEMILDKSTNDQLENNLDNAKTDKNLTKKSNGEFTIKSIGENLDRKYVLSITSNEHDSNKENESISRNLSLLSIIGQNESSPKIENSEKELRQNKNIKELELIKSSIEVEDSKDSQTLNSDNITTSTTSKTEFTIPKDNSDATNETYISNKEKLKKYQMNSDQKTEASTSRIGLVDENKINRMISEKFNTENPTKSQEYSNNKILSTTSSADSSEKDGKLSTNIHPVRNEREVTERIFMHNLSITAMQNDSVTVSSKADIKQPTPKEKLLNVSTLPKDEMSIVHTNSKESSTSPATETVLSKADKKQPTPKEKLLNVSTSPKDAMSIVHTNSKESSTLPATEDNFFLKLEM